MLAEITIKDFAIIDNLTLQFSNGFNVLTGETGAGKSIILDAVQLLLGDRADTDTVRANTDMALIEGIFVLHEGPVLTTVNEVLTREGLEGEAPDILTLSREIRSGGRSISRVNGRTVTLGILKEISGGLIDIHGQGEHLSILNPKSHIGLLDRYGGLDGQRRDFSALVREINKVRADLKHLRDNEAALQQRAEMLGYQVEEIASAKLKPGEDKDLEDEARKLANSEQLADLSNEAYQAVNGSDEDTISANDRLSQAALALSRLIKFDPEAADLATLAEEVSIQVEELGRSLSDYVDTLEFDPMRLSEVEMRLDMIQRLKRKYSAETIEELITTGDEAATELATIDGGEERIAALEKDEEKLLLKIAEAGVALSRARQDVADKLATGIEVELGDLRMEEARFGISIEQKDDPKGVPIGEQTFAFDRTGIDHVEFLIAPNIGEPLKPVAKVASGGETSRIMLALKTVLTRADETPTLIFDEIDQGIGGRVGITVGEKLWGLSSNHQVMVVTHLPQLAGFADTHFKVEKQIEKKRTITHVNMLDGDTRIDELTEMLGAEADSARQNAQEILAYAEEIKGHAAPAA